MKYFSILIVNTEYKLYDFDNGDIFFILNKKFGKNFTSNLFEYDYIASDIEKWLLDAIKTIPESEIEEIKFDYYKTIKSISMTRKRNEQLEKLGI